MRTEAEIREAVAVQGQILNGYREFLNKLAGDFRGEGVRRLREARVRIRVTQGEIETLQWVLGERQ